MPELPQTARILPSQTLPVPGRIEDPEPRREGVRTILLIDDHAMIRQGLREIFHTLPSLQVTMEASNAEEAHANLSVSTPDLVITDLLLLEGPDGIQLTKAIKARRHDLPVLLLSGQDEALFAERAIDAGASGFVMKDADLEALFQAIEAALEGRIWVSDDMRSRLLPAPPPASHLAPILPADVLHQILGGNRTVLGLNRALSRSIASIEGILDRAQRRLGLPSRVALFLLAMELDHPTPV
ncbi:MAG TPA: response regulator transcription factor [Deltaproteobacteria bacterium]|nr:response regulator transcription factor [Deltaproteobacteria bacterium]